MDLALLAKVLTGAASLVGAVSKFFGRGGEAAQYQPPEANGANQRQEQAAGAARNYSSRRTELAERAKRQD